MAQILYFCLKFGPKESLKRRGLKTSPEQYLHSLLGRIAFALQIDPANLEMQGYHSQIKELTAQL